jgi:predicted O-methyltransferase YrrM
MSLSLLKLRSKWRDLNVRVQGLERQLGETQMIVDILLSDARFDPAGQQGLNMQERRKEIVADLFARFRFDAVLETGTYLGASTGYFASTYRVPVYTSEVLPRNYHVARRILRDVLGVHLHLLDSREFLRSLVRNGTLPGKRLFCYLDAHWYDDLPLAEEIEIISSGWSDFVIMIDDFCVPGDDGYGFDDYGAARRLDVDYVEPVRQRAGLSLYFPSASSQSETGRKRGTAVLASRSLAAECSGCSLLKQYR